MEQKHLPSFGGLLGMNVLRLRRGCGGASGRAELLLGADGWEARTRFCRAAVIFSTRTGVFFRGNHFIAAAHTAAGFVFHNAPQLPPDRAFAMEEAVARLKQAGHTPLILIVL